MLFMKQITIFFFFLTSTLRDIPSIYIDDVLDSEKKIAMLDF